MDHKPLAMCHACQQCQHGKICKQPAAPLHSIPVPTSRFFHVQVDLMDPLPASLEGHMYLLTRIDRSTRWVEAMPASYAAAADSLMCLCVLAASRRRWRAYMAAIPGGGQGAGDHFCGPPEGQTGSSRVSPAEVTSCGHPPKKSATPAIQHVSS